jgi:muramidase (phage lysozyme)
VYIGGWSTNRGDDVARITQSEAGGANACAFLDMIRWSELKPGLLAASDDGYNVLVGSTAAYPHLFKSYADHPRLVVTLHNKAGAVIGRSSAAGGPQFLIHTWDVLAERLGLTDFSPLNQDRGAIELLRGCRAYPQIVAGNIEAAIHLARSIWASFPGAGYGQPENQLSKLVAAFLTALGKAKPDFSNVESGADTVDQAWFSAIHNVPDFSNVQSGVDTTAPHSSAPSS